MRLAASLPLCYDESGGRRFLVKKRCFCIFLTLVTVLCLCAPAFADMGPKPRIVLRAENEPDGLYYVDLLVEDEGRNHALDPEGYDETMLAALREYQDGAWHAARTTGTNVPLFGDITGTETDHGREFTFSYIPPQRYRVILVTEDGSVRVSEEVYERARFFETMTLDCDTMTLTPYYDIPFAKIAQQLFATLVPTLLIEGLLLVLFGLARNRRNLLCFLWTNLATQLVLTVFLSYTLPRAGLVIANLLLIPVLELIILIAETVVYRRFLTGRSKARCTLYGVTANLASWLLGVWLMFEFPIWG